MRNGGTTFLAAVVAVEEPAFAVVSHVIGAPHVVAGDRLDVLHLAGSTLNVEDFDRAVCAGLVLFKKLAFVVDRRAVIDEIESESISALYFDVETEQIEALVTGSSLVAGWLESPHSVEAIKARVVNIQDRNVVG